MKQLPGSGSCLPLLSSAPAFSSLVSSSAGVLSSLVLFWGCLVVLWAGRAILYFFGHSIWNYFNCFLIARRLERRFPSVVVTVFNVTYIALLDHFYFRRWCCGIRKREIWHYAKHASAADLVCFCNGVWGKVWGAFHFQSIVHWFIIYLLHTLALVDYRNLLWAVTSQSEPYETRQPINSFWARWRSRLAAAVFFNSIKFPVQTLNLRVWYGACLVTIYFVYCSFRWWILPVTKWVCLALASRSFQWPKKTWKPLPACDGSLGYTSTTLLSVS